MLRLPSGIEVVYSSWPNFQIMQRFTRTERERGSVVAEEETVRAIGEVESGNTPQNGAMAQAGIYTLSHLQST